MQEALPLSNHIGTDGVIAGHGIKCMARLLHRQAAGDQAVGLQIATGYELQEAAIAGGGAAFDGRLIEKHRNRVAGKQGAAPAASWTI